MKKEHWVWMPHAAHWILGSRCRFHLATYVGKYIVSTVGECPKSGEDWRETQNFERVGTGKECYETMVFLAERAPNNTCCPWRQASGTDVDGKRYLTAEDAREGHMTFCKKWGKRSKR